MLFVGGDFELRNCVVAGFNLAAISFAPRIVGNQLFMESEGANDRFHLFVTLW